jgi:hypothetical protein
MSWNGSMAERGGFESRAPFKLARSLGSSEAFDERELSFIPRLVGAISHHAVTARGEDRLDFIPGKIPGSLDSKPQYLRALQRGAERS